MDYNDVSIVESVQIHKKLGIKPRFKPNPPPNPKFGVYEGDKLEREEVVRIARKIWKKVNTGTKR